MIDANIRLVLRPGLEPLISALARKLNASSEDAGPLRWNEDGVRIEALLTEDAHEAPIPAIIASPSGCTLRIRHPDENPWCASCLADAFPEAAETASAASSGDASTRTSAHIQLDRATSPDQHAQHLLQAVRLLTRRLDAARAVLALGRTV